MPAKTDRTMPDNHSEPANRQNHQSGGVHNAAVECRSPPGHQSVSTRPRPIADLNRNRVIGPPIALVYRGSTAHCRKRSKMSEKVVKGWSYHNARRFLL